MDIKIALFLTQENQTFVPPKLPEYSYPYINVARKEIRKEFVCFFERNENKIICFSDIFLPLLPKYQDFSFHVQNNRPSRAY